VGRAQPGGGERGRAGGALEVAHTDVIAGLTRNPSRGFTKRHGVKTLVWFESTRSAEAAIGREKQIKNWKREWKIALIQKTNPGWRDLYEELL
jgi:predicted GIY-YIG superfamily endonuclease